MRFPPGPTVELSGRRCHGTGVGAGLELGVGMGEVGSADAIINRRLHGLGGADPEQIQADGQTDSRAFGQP